MDGGEGPRVRGRSSGGGARVRQESSRPSHGRQLGPLQTQYRQCNAGRGSWVHGGKERGWEKDCQHVVWNCPAYMYIGPSLHLVKQDAVNFGNW